MLDKPVGMIGDGPCRDVDVLRNTLTTTNIFTKRSRRVIGFFFFSSRRRHTRFDCDWSSDVCSSDLERVPDLFLVAESGGRVVGSVVGGWDNWRGHVYRLAVHPAFRRRGLGRELAAEDRKSVV